MRKVIGVFVGILSIYGFCYIVDRTLYWLDFWDWWTMPTLLIIWLGTAIVLGTITTLIYGE